MLLLSFFSLLNCLLNTFSTFSKYLVCTFISGSFKFLINVQTTNFDTALKLFKQANKEKENN